MEVSRSVSIVHDADEHYVRTSGADFIVLDGVVEGLPQEVC
jgi:hypothetical protein